MLGKEKLCCTWLTIRDAIANAYGGLQRWWTWVYALWPLAFYFLGNDKGVCRKSATQWKKNVNHKCNIPIPKGQKRTCYGPVDGQVDPGRPD